MPPIHPLSEYKISRHPPCPAQMQAAARRSTRLAARCAPRSLSHVGVRGERAALQCRRVRDAAAHIKNKRHKKARNSPSGARFPGAAEGSLGEGEEGGTAARGTAMIAAMLKSVAAGAAEFEAGRKLQSSMAPMRSMWRRLSGHCRPHALLNTSLRLRE